MQAKSFALAFVSAVGLTSAIPQAVTSAIAPSQAAPAGCQPTFAGNFNIATVNVTTASKRSLEERSRLIERQLSGTLTLTLNGGVLKDMAGRTGYIASNFQFQFDGPPQAGAIYTAGFSVCSNDTLALGGSAIFYACQSGGFYNLYNKNWAPQCDPIYIQAVPAGDNSGESGDGQPTAGSAIPSVTEKSEGQPGATSVASSVISEKPEGQPIGTTVGTIVTEASDGQPVAATSAPSAPAPITTSLPVVSEKSEGQPVGSSVPVVSEKPEGQPVASSALVVSEKPEGQPVASSAAASGPASATPVVSEKPEGQPVASAGAGSNSTFTAATPTSGSASSASSPAVQASAGASQIGYNMAGLAMGVVGAMAFL